MVSEISNIETIIKMILKVDPKTIIDIGSGFGKYGILVREAILSDRTLKGELSPKNDIIIDCVENCSYFYNLPFHQAIYDHHFHEDIRKLELGNYDLALMIDIIEHFEKEEAKELLKKMKKTMKNILVCTPKKVVFYKEHFYGSEGSLHHSQFFPEDFYEAFPEAIDCSTEKSYIFLL